jgi:hypothetical protein
VSSAFWLTRQKRDDGERSWCCNDLQGSKVIAKFRRQYLCIGQQVDSAGTIDLRQHHNLGGTELTTARARATCRETHILRDFARPEYSAFRTRGPAHLCSDVPRRSRMGKRRQDKENWPRRYDFAGSPPTRNVEIRAVFTADADVAAVSVARSGTRYRNQ